MTNTEKLAWLNDMNAHLAAGGKLEYKLTDSTWTSEYGTNPQWHSDPINWRKVPLPRKATIRVAYRWTETDAPQYCLLGVDRPWPAGAEWQVAEIEVTEQVK